ncbi:kinase-like protein [Cyathus striatus]|nr:kinase-like protein [Cyathus striatus]
MFSSIFQHIRLALYFLLSSYFDGRVRLFRFGIPLVLKHTPRQYSTEADALRFLNDSKLPLPIPKLIDSIKFRGGTYTLMTRIPGKTMLVSLIQGSVSEDNITSIVADLKPVLYNLWKLKQNAADEGKIMMSASGDGLPDSLGTFDYHSGPVNTILECYANLTRHLQDMRHPEWNESTLMESYPEATRAVISDDISWVHMDFRPHNIMVHNGKFSGLIDWEDSGWLPRHWQLYTLRRFTFGTPRSYAENWRNTEFPPQTEAAFKAGYELLYYPVV